MERTTNLDKVKAGEQFTWGNVVRIHELGRYAIAEFHPWKAKGVQVFVGQESKETSFHTWVDGRDISCSWGTLEGAIAGAIAWKYDGANSQAGELFCRMIRLPEPIVRCEEE